MAPGAQAQRPPSLGRGCSRGPERHPALQLQQLPEQRRGRDPLPGVAGAGDAVLRPAAAADNDDGAHGARCSRSCRRTGSRTSSSTAIRATRSRAAPCPLGNPQGALELRALGDKYGIRFPARHGSLNEARWDAEINVSRILGQDHVGESGPGGAGGVGSYQQTLRTAEQLNKLGKRSVEAGPRPGVLPQPRGRVRRDLRFMDNGVLKSGWEIVMERTDPRWVVAQIDIGWAVCGGSGHVTPSDPAVGVAYVQRMIDKFGPRVISFHVKDMAADGIRPNCGNPEQRTLGQGAINFAPMLASRQERDEVLLRRARPGRHRRADELQPVQQHRRQRGRAQGRPRADAEGQPAAASLRARRHRRGREPEADRHHQRR